MQDTGPARAVPEAILDRPEIHSAPACHGRPECCQRVVGALARDPVGALNDNFGRYPTICCPDKGIEDAGNVEHGVADDQEPLSCRIDDLKDNLLRPSEGDDAHIWVGPDQFDGLPLSMVPLGKSGCEECGGNGLRQDAPGLRMPPIEEADHDRPVVGAREGLCDLGSQRSPVGTIAPPETGYDAIPLN